MIRLLFAAVILWQPIQYLIAVRFGEPYPALIMPAFAGTLVDREGNIRFGDVKCKVLLQDGRTTLLSAYDLLSVAPSAHHGAIMAHMFSPPAPPIDPWPAGSLKARLFPGRALSRIRKTQNILDPQTKDWLKHRLETIYPGEEPESITFVWYEDVFNVKQVPPKSTQEPVGLREVSFD
jgi:hypothetical protein